MTNKSFGHRNPLIVTPMGNFLDTLGDCHMGRVFRNDVPLDRRGEYEKFQLKTLNQLLNKPLPKGCNKFKLTLQGSGVFSLNPDGEFEFVDTHVAYSIFLKGVEYAEAKTNVIEGEAKVIEGEAKVIEGEAND